MLPEFAKSAAALLPRITKSYDGKKADTLGAFPCGSVLEIEAWLPRRLASSGIILRISRDTMAPGEEELSADYCDFPFDFVSTDFQNDKYRLALDTSLLCREGSGLFYYEYLFPRGMDTLFSDTADNVNFTLSGESRGRFRLLLYKKEYKTPGIGNGIMYHIFVDRFCRGAGGVSYRQDSVIHGSWDGEVPEYAKIRGGKIANNDFFGGNLWGVIEKLDYLEQLGVNIIYLSPVFDSPSNHKYDCSDYTKIDKGFGGSEAFEQLLSETKKRGMCVILDGVFNHTGADSVYFDRNGKYGLPASDEKSDHHAWYRFSPEYKNGYEAWWDIDILPRLCTDRDDVREYFAGRNGICADYAKKGCGWRLDVADELPDRFLEELRASVKAKNTDAMIIGEVWENAADKIAYGKRRSYFRGKQLDSVMNYPLRRALLDFGAYGDAKALGIALTELWSSYPKCANSCLMNVIGTHDTYRALSFLGDPSGVSRLDCESDNSVLASFGLSKERYELALKRLRAVSVLQYTVFGFPCVYYGDETGMEGLGDPFCRMPMKWGDKADSSLLEHYRRLGKIRRTEAAFAGGDFRILRAENGIIVFERSKKGGSATEGTDYDRINTTAASNDLTIAKSSRTDGAPTEIIVAVNCGSTSAELNLSGTDLYSCQKINGKITIEPYGFVIVKN